MPPVLATFLFELVNFLLLAGLLGWLLFKPVRGMLEARQAATRKQTDDLTARLAEADGMRAELRDQQAAFEREMTDTRAARLAAAEKEAAATVASAQEAAERERTRATRMLAHLEQAEIETLAAAVAAAAREAVARLMTTVDAPELEAGLLRAACRQLQALDAQSLGTVFVESAKPLGDQDRAAILEAIGTRAGAPEFRVVADLGAGLRVTTARGRIDASAAGIAAEAERRLTERLAVEDSEPST